MNLDRTFCVSTECPLSGLCDRHHDRLKEWCAIGKNAERIAGRGISVANFYKAGEKCKRFSKRDHQESSDCWCHPVLNYKDESGAEHWVHNDTREGALN